jgi:hypothetical protein
MIHPDTKLQYIDDEKGYGVVATKKIPKGTITWALDKFDFEFQPEEVQAMEPIYKRIIDTYSYRNQHGNFILCWDFGRYVNHSFHSNCMSTAYEFEIAIRDIEQGEELTDDYGYLNIVKPFKAQDENTTRKYVYPDDLLRYHKEWDNLVLGVLPILRNVDQPLMPLLKPEFLNELNEVIDGKREMRSVIEVYYDEVKIHIGDPLLFKV